MSTRSKPAGNGEVFPLVVCDPRVHRQTRPIPRLALRVGEAAEALGLSDDFFREHVADELRWVRRGAVKVVPLSELERWLETSASRVFEGEL
jgi:hypothetical protein